MNSASTERDSSRDHERQYGEATHGEQQWPFRKSHQDAPFPAFGERSPACPRSLTWRCFARTWRASYQLSGVHYPASSLLFPSFFAMHSPHQTAILRQARQICLPGALYAVGYIDLSERCWRVSGERTCELAVEGVAPDRLHVKGTVDITWEGELSNAAAYTPYSGTYYCVSVLFGVVGRGGYSWVVSIVDRAALVSRESIVRAATSTV